MLLTAGDQLPVIAGTFVELLGKVNKSPLQIGPTWENVGIVFWLTCTTPLYIFNESTQHEPLDQPPVVQSSNILMEIDKSSGVHVWATVTWKLILNGPSDDVPQPEVPELTNLQPGPKLKPLVYVCCKSHVQLPFDPPGFNGAVRGFKLVHPIPKLIWNACIQFIFIPLKLPNE